MDHQQEPRIKISDIIAKENYSPDEMELLKVEVRLFLKKMEAIQTEILAERSNRSSSPVVLENFFRDKERYEKTGQILQYLLAFLVHIPGSIESANKPFSPIEQFRECICFEVDLLLEEDVNKAVFNEINQPGSRNGNNIWDFQGRVIEKNRELNKLINKSISEVSSILFTMCLVLEHLCLFWFDVKQEDIRRIRRSDIYMYKLARILQGRSRQI